MPVVLPIVLMLMGALAGCTSLAAPLSSENAKVLAASCENGEVIYANIVAVSALLVGLARTRRWAVFITFPYSARMTGCPTKCNR